MRHDNYWLTVLRTARTYRKYPCEHMGLDRDVEVDFLLTTALEIYDQSFCPGGCGQYAEEAHDAANMGRYERRTITCQACAAMTPGDGHKASPGELAYVWRNPKEPRRRRSRGAARPVRN